MRVGVGVALFVFFEVLSSVFLPALAHAQVEPPDRRYLFIEDKYKKVTEKKKRQTIAARRKAVESERKKAASLPFDIDAKNLHSSGNTISADGGLTIGFQNTLIEAEQGQVNTETKDAQLTGDVRIGDPTGTVTADKAFINLGSKEGWLEDAKLEFTDGDYRISGSKITRLSGDTFELEEPSFTTCECPEDNSVPWQIDGSRGRVTRDGYGHVWNATFNVCQVPILYTPYLLFPAKSKRQTGLLVPDVGYGKRNGFEYQQPFFWDINSSTDATISPLIETKTRVGTDLEFRKAFGLTNNLEAGGTYLNESARDGDLRGTNVSDLSDPTLDTNRTAGYLDHIWKGRIGEEPFQLLIHGRYVSDDLYLREIENSKIGEYNDRYVTSTALLRMPLGDDFSFDLSSEFNQAMIDNDDFVFQRLPSLDLNGYHSFRPFGTNPLGLKLVLSDALSVTNFTRKESYEGGRGEVLERLKLPFHYRNFFESELSGDVTMSDYELSTSDDFVPEKPEDRQTFADSSQRLVPGVSYRLSTVVEKVMPVEEGNWIKYIGELGPIGRSQELTRLKHTIEPIAKYRWVPEVNQDDIPIFDSDDRLDQKNVVTAGVVQRLYARYEPRNPYLYGVEEIVPEMHDLSSLHSTAPLDPSLDYSGASAAAGDLQALSLGSIKELATFKVTQSYDINEEMDDLLVDQGPFSDTNFDLILYPNDYVALRATTNYNFEDSDFSSYTIGGQLSSKRGDQLRSRLSFVDGSARQLDSSIEVKVTDFTKFAYFSRYDDLAGEFIENRFGTRFYSSCNCWVFDVTVDDKINPDETRLMFNATLFGLGEFGNTVYSKTK